MKKIVERKILFGLREDRRLMVEFVGSGLNSRAWFLIVCQNSEVKLIPNERSRLILTGSRFKPLGISPSANQR